MTRRWCEACWDYHARVPEHPKPGCIFGQGDKLKQCARCGEYLPATARYFQRRQLSKDGLQSRCKRCVCKRRSQCADKYCAQCMGLPHRRPKRGLCRYRETYEAEPAARADGTARVYQEAI